MTGGKEGQRQTLRLGLSNRGAGGNTRGHGRILIPVYYQHLGAWVSNTSGLPSPAHLMLAVQVCT